MRAAAAWGSSFGKALCLSNCKIANRRGALAGEAAAGAPRRAAPRLRALAARLQCGKFQPMSDFDGGKRSCRKTLQASLPGKN